MTCLRVAVSQPPAKLNAEKSSCEGGGGGYDPCVSRERDEGIIDRPVMAAPWRLMTVEAHVRRERHNRRDKASHRNMSS